MSLRCNRLRHCQAWPARTRHQHTQPARRTAQRGLMLDSVPLTSGDGVAEPLRADPGGAATFCLPFRDQQPLRRLKASLLAALLVPSSLDKSKSGCRIGGLDHVG